MPEIYPATPLPDNVDSCDIKELNRRVRTLLNAAPDSGYGLEIGRSLHICDFGIVGYAAMNGGSLLEALRTTVRYRSLLASGLRTHLEETEDHFEYIVELERDDPSLYPLIELELAGCIRFAHLTTCPQKAFPVKIKRASFKHTPLTQVKHYQHALGCAPTFNASRNSLLIEASGMHQPTQNPNSTLFKLLNEKLVSMLEYSVPHVTFKERVECYLSTAMPSEFPSQEGVAAHFCISTSSLKRKLRDEGCSYRSLFDEQRFKIAEKALKEGNESIKQISYRLGFSDQSAFNRAFKRWSGMNPLDYRHEELDEA